MLQSSKLLATLKTMLKNKGVAYKEVGEILGISESRTKALFSSNDISLQRLEVICDYIGVSFFDLTSACQENDDSLNELTWEQEEFLATNTKHLFFFYLLIQNWELDEIKKNYCFEAEEIEKIIRSLESLKLTTYVNKKLKIKVSKSFNWISKGPVWSFYEKKIMTELLEDSFSKKNDFLKFFSAEITPAAKEKICTKLKQTASDINELIELDKKVSHEHRESTGLILAFRSWVLSEFQNLQR